MLRRTAARAFGASAEDSSTGEPPAAYRATLLPPGGESLRRGRVVDRLFEELHAALDARLRRARGAQPDADEDAAARLTRPRPRLEGLEFRLDGPRGTVRVIHSLRGFLRITCRDGASSPPGGSRPDELVSVERQGGEYRPLVKPLPAPSGPRPSPRPASRTGFRFTSVAELVDRLLARVGLEPPAALGTISNVDTFGKVP